MTTFADIKKLLDDQGEAFAGFKAVNDDRLKAVEEGNTTLAAELEAKLAPWETQLSDVAIKITEGTVDYEAVKSRVEELEMLMRTPGGDAFLKQSDGHTKAWVNWMRNPELDSAKATLREAEKKFYEAKFGDMAAKAITTTAGATGGFAVPEEIARDIEKLEQKFSPVRDLVKVVQVGTSDYKELVSRKGGASAGWVGEDASRTATGTPELREVAPTMGELYAYPQVSEWSLDDMFFNVQGFVTEFVAEEFAILEGQAVLSGNGTTKPTGMTNASLVTTDDHASPLRAAEAYEKIGIVSPAASPVVDLTFDSLITAIYTLNSRYRMGAAWVMNSLTTGNIRRLKDSDGQYLWSPGLIVGEAPQLLGYAFHTWEDMPDVAAGNAPVAFGNFKRGYLLVDRIGMRMTRDEVTAPGFVKFYVRRREGGKPLNNDAIKFISVE